MIKQSEIQKIAQKQGLRDAQIEKDYVLGWVLRCISKNNFLKKHLIFKGGTLLRKAYFKNYRLSEDLDFTFVNKKGHAKTIVPEFEKVTELVFEKSRISLDIFDVKKRLSGNLTFFLKYSGPLGGKVAHKKIKTDISFDENVFYKPIEKTFKDIYSDSELFTLPVYSLEEVAAEKLRSLMQRTEARDVYDIWFLLKFGRLKTENILTIFNIKAIAKNIHSKELPEIVKKKQNVFEKQWENRLSHQIKDMPPFKEIWRELFRNFRKFNLSK